MVLSKNDADNFNVNIANNNNFKYSSIRLNYCEKLKAIDQIDF